MSKSKYTKEIKELMAKMYINGKSTTEIANELKSNLWTVNTFLKEQNIVLRSISEAMLLRVGLTKEEQIIRNKFLKDIRSLSEIIFWKAKVIVRDNFTCQKCGYFNNFDKPYIPIHVDHIKPFSIILLENNIRSIQQARECQELWDINNGRCLCKYCHKKENNRPVRKIGVKL